MKNKQIIVRVTDELKDEFTRHCIKQGYSPSKRLRVLIEVDIKNKSYDGCGLQNDKHK